MPGELGRGAQVSTTTGGAAGLVLRLVAAVGLAVSASVHVDLAEGPLFADGQVTLAGLFVADAVAAATAAVFVLVRGSHPAWLVVALVAVPSLLALVVTTYVKVPSVGPLPAVYEPFWYAEKVAAAAGATVAALTALVALARLGRRDRLPVR